MVQSKKVARSPKEKNTNDNGMTVQKKRKGIRRQYRKLSSEDLLKRISTMQTRTVKLEEKLNRSNTTLKSLQTEQEIRNQVTVDDL